MVRVNVTACLVTRGDVLLQPILKSLPPEWEVVIFNNGLGRVAVPPKGSLNVYDDRWMKKISDLSVYGRYAAIEHATHDIIYVQDDDVIVSDPQEIVDRFQAELCGDPKFEWDGVVCNMPQEFRHDFYQDHALVGFGAVFLRDEPQKAFDRWWLNVGKWDDDALFRRCCDVVFTGLTPRVLVDIPKENLPYASDDNRMWKQPEHIGERRRMLDLVRRVRDH